MENNNSPLIEIMQERLPCISYQKRLGYRTSVKEVEELYKIINHNIFDNKLEMPELVVASRCRKYWGMCYGEAELFDGTQSYCRIKLMDKWFCRQWLVTVLAHEMCHQYQWDIIGPQREELGKMPIMSHGPTFFMYRDRLNNHGISLKRAHSKKKWFMTQDFFKS